MHDRFDSHTRSAALVVALCICGVVSLSAQSPFDQTAMSIQRAVTGPARFLLGSAIAVVAGLRWAGGGGARHLGPVLGGLSLAFFVNEIMAWLRFN